MDIPFLAGAVVAALSPYLATAGQELAQQVGDKAIPWLGELYQTLLKRFKKSTSTGKALKDLAAAPNQPDTQNALKD